MSSPRRRVRRLRRIPSLWARLGALTVIVIALFIGMIGLALKAARPYRMASRETARLVHIRGKVASLTMANDVLERQISYLKTPSGVAEEAHHLGYMRPGERPLIILGVSASAADPPSALEDNVPTSSPDAVAGESSPLHRFFRHLRDL